MSIPPHYATTRNLSEAVEDCRDYLRTGRCKYGASCKYNHPPNVQSGGGMKAPLDPNEPLYPVRPNEPICQYYMKHGTCKFAQACKFHHPPQNANHQLGSSVSMVMMNSQLVLSPIDGGNSSVMLQVLPQRPDEPDCIYFLKNGRCKYGATCRYHHPLNYHQRRAEEQRRHHEQQRRNNYQQVHYVTQQMAGLPQGHVFMGDNPLTLVNVDRDGHQSYQQLSIITGADGTSSYCVPLGSTVGTTEQGSSASSIASSFNTADSNHDHLHNEGGLWTRRSGSANSLKAHGDLRGQPPRAMSHSASDGNIARRSRASSYGSAGEQPALCESSNNPSLRRSGSNGSWVGAQFDNSKPASHPQYDSMKSPDMRRARPPGLNSPTRRIVRRGRGPHGDEGFTMMTSALLNMLDTPEELPSEAYSDEDAYPPSAGYPTQVSPEVDEAMFERLSLHHDHDEGGYVPRPDGGDQSWSPPWQSSAAGPRVDDDDAHVMHMMRSHQQQGSSAGNQGHDDVGLYLP